MILCIGLDFLHHAANCGVPKPPEKITIFPRKHLHWGGAHITNYTVLDIILKNNLMQQAVELQDHLEMELL